MIKKVLKNIDYVILILVVLLFAIGIVALNSASHGAGEVEAKFSKQIIWFVVGVFMSFSMAFFDYKTLKKIIIPIYFISLIMLLLVLRTSPINGARSWFQVGPMSLQPSEFFKIILIISVATFLDFVSENDGINKIYNLLISFGIIALPIFLIIKQPDYGTAMVGIIIFAMMIFSAGLNWKYIVFAIVSLVVALPLLYFFILPEHAKTRIDVFLNPDLDPRGAGYNIIQSELAIGSGMVLRQRSAKWYANSDGAFANENN